MATKSGIIRLKDIKQGRTFYVWTKSHELHTLFIESAPKDTPYGMMFDVRVIYGPHKPSDQRNLFVFNFVRHPEAPNMPFNANKKSHLFKTRNYAKRWKENEGRKNNRGIPKVERDEFDPFALSFDSFRTTGIVHNDNDFSIDRTARYASISPMGLMNVDGKMVHFSVNMAPSKKLDIRYRGIDQLDMCRKHRADNNFVEVLQTNQPTPSDDVGAYWKGVFDSSGPQPNRSVGESMISDAGLAFLQLQEKELTPEEKENQSGIAKAILSAEPFIPGTFEVPEASGSVGKCGNCGKCKCPTKGK